MNNIFDKLNLQNYFYGIYLNFKDIKEDLFDYLYENLYNENKTLSWNFQLALTNNANGEYI